MKRLLVSLLLMLAFSPILSQKWGGFANFTLGLPQNEYKSLNDRTGIGFRGGVLYRPQKDLPISFGFEAGYLSLGREVLPSNSSGFWSPYSAYRVVAGVNVVSLNASLRIQSPNNASVKPFIEGLVGWNNFYGTVSTEGRRLFDFEWERIIQESTKGDWALSYGGAAGLDARIDKSGHLWLEFRVSYMKGRQARYYTDPIISGNGSVTYVEKSSTTDLLFPQIGLKFGL